MGFVGITCAKSFLPIMAASADTPHPPEHLRCVILLPDGRRYTGMQGGYLDFYYDLPDAPTTAATAHDRYWAHLREPEKINELGWLNLRMYATRDDLAFKAVLERFYAGESYGELGPSYYDSIIQGHWMRPEALRHLHEFHIIGQGLTHYDPTIDYAQHIVTVLDNARR